MRKETPLEFPSIAITVKVTVKRVNRFGSYVPAILMTYSDLVPKKVIKWVKRHIAKELEIMKNSTK